MTRRQGYYKQLNEEAGLTKLGRHSFFRLCLKKSSKVAKSSSGQVLHTLSMSTHSPREGLAISQGSKVLVTCLTIHIHSGLRLLLIGFSSGADFCVAAHFLSFRRKHLDKYSPGNYTPEMIYITNSTHCTRKRKHPSSHTDYLFFYLEKF